MVEPMGKSLLKELRDRALTNADTLSTPAATRLDQPKRDIKGVFEEIGKELNPLTAPIRWIGNRFAQFLFHFHIGDTKFESPPRRVKRHARNSWRRL